jgi:hypothetical protein
MYGKRQTKACPMCTAWLDGANGVALTSLKISISQSSPPLMSPLCAPTLARGAGTSCASLAPATAPSNTI